MTAAAAPRPLLEVEGLAVHFPVRRGLLGRQVGTVKAVDGVSFSVAAGATLGLVGESGCGKSTTARAILRLIEPSAGKVRLDGVEITALGSADLRRARRKMQMVFQDPYASLDPRMTLLDIVAEPLRAHRLAKGSAATKRVTELMEQVGLGPGYLRRYPHELSGGQRQRVGIARALALGPELIVADEPVSALDTSIRAQIINLLAELQRELGVAYLFIAHDLAVVRHISDEVAVMYLGKIVEKAPVNELFAAPRHPYTQALLGAVLVPDPRRERQRARLPVVGEPPSPAAPPAGCSFHPRCPHVFARCRTEAPELLDRGAGHLCACHLDALPAPGPAARPEAAETRAPNGARS
jgi:oligopeptide/dipeptide ABC transporter ATP-binding protein